MNRLKQVYDDSSGKSALTYKELQGGFRDCGINLGTEDFNRLVSAADKSNKGYVSFDNIVKVVEKAGLGVPKDVTYFANQHYTKTSNKAMAAGRPSKPSPRLREHLRAGSASRRRTLSIFRKRPATARRAANRLSQSRPFSSLL